jgi:hypothetical protein
MAEREIPWARDLQKHHLSAGADPLYTDLMIDIAVLHTPMLPSGSPGREVLIPLAVRYLVANEDVVVAAISIWEAMSAEERADLAHRHQELHYPEAMNARWSLSLLKRAPRVLAELEQMRSSSGQASVDNLFLTIDEDDLNQLRRLLEYAKWGRSDNGQVLALHPVEQFLL